MSNVYITVQVILEENIRTNLHYSCGNRNNKVTKWLMILVMLCKVKRLS